MAAQNDEQVEESLPGPGPPEPELLIGEHHS